MWNVAQDITPLFLHVFSNFAIGAIYIILFAWWLLDEFAYEYLEEIMRNVASGHPVLFTIGVIGLFGAALFLALWYFVKKVKEEIDTTGK